MKIKHFIFAGLTLFLPLFVFADSAGTSSGLVLLKDSGARSTALGDAFTSMTNDITAMDFNPASLATLESNHLSLQYERGFFNDSFSKSMFGMSGPLNGSIGVSLGYYNSGKQTLFDGVNPQQSLTAEQDRFAGLGYGFHTKSLELGASAKYLWSQLAEANTASAVSTEVGLQYQLAKSFRLGVSGPLFQSKLNYANTAENLPKVYRAGIGWTGYIPLATGNLPLHLLTDVPYDADARAYSIGFGAETQIGIMALRLGFNTTSTIQQFSMGTGFQFHQMSLDYSFGLVSNSAFDAVQKVNLSFRFNNFADAQKAKATELSMKKPKEEKWGLAINQKDQGPFLTSNLASNGGSVETPGEQISKYHAMIPLDHENSRIYEVQPGETIQSITAAQYGASADWHEVFSVNSHLYSSPDDIKPGCKILLPVRKGS